MEYDISLKGVIFQKYDFRNNMRSLLEKFQLPEIRKINFIFLHLLIINIEEIRTRMGTGKYIA